VATKSAQHVRRSAEDSAPAFRIGDTARANLFAPADFQGRRGFITEVGPGASEYRVEFEDNLTPTTGYLMAWWLEPDEPPR
jgi:hypothetical protein